MSGSPPPGLTERTVPAEPVQVLDPRLDEIELVASDRPWWQRPTTVLLALGVAYVVGFASEFVVYTAGLAVIYGIAAVGQQWLIGRSGQISVGGASFMFIGAVTTAQLDDQAWAPFPVPLIVSMIFGAAVGFVAGVPGLRFRGLYLIMTTLALHFIVQFAGIQYSKSHPFGFTAEVPDVLWWKLDNGVTGFVILVLILGLVVAALKGMYGAAPGRAWRAVAESDRAAATMGIDPVRWRVLAFVGSSAVTAGAGSLLAGYLGVVTVETFSLLLAMNLIIMVFVGGEHWIGGAIIGAVIVTFMPTWLTDLADATKDVPVLDTWLAGNVPAFSTLFFGVILLLIFLFEPEGLMAAVPRIVRAARSIGRREVPAPTASAAPVAATRIGVSAGTTGDPGFLHVRDLHVTYSDGAVGVAGADLDVGRGEIVAILGRNGAGKTSLLRALSGFQSMERVRVAGSVEIDGRGFLGSGPAASRRQGVVMVPARDKVFPGLSVADNLRVVTDDPSAALERFDALQPRLRQPAATLSGGERQMLALAMAFAQHPRVLLIDEMSLGLAPVIVKRLLQQLRIVAAEANTSIVLVEQDAASALAVADRCLVLDHGVVTWQGPASELRGSDRIRALVLGETS